jgi:hypothetical protein
MIRFKKTHKKNIHRCDDNVQRLKDSIRGTVSTDYLETALDAIEKLPILNNKVINIPNKKGVIVEVVGKHGSSIKYGVSFKNGICYFDGNKIGKRKRRIIAGFFKDNIIPDNEDQNKVVKIWKKLQQQGRL